MSILLSDLLFYLYFGIMLIAKGVGMVDGTIPFKIALVASFLCVLLKIVLEEYSIIEYLFITALLTLGIVIWQVSGNQAAIVMFLLLVSLKKVDIKKSFRYAAVVWGFSFLFQVITHLLNLRKQDFVIHTKFGLGYVIRWALGYSHPNVLQIAYVVAIAYIMYAYNWTRKKAICFTVLSFIGAMYIFLFSLSSTGIIMYILLIAGFVFFSFRAENKKKLKTIEKCLLNMIFPISVFSAIVLPLILKGKAFDVVNSIMQHRPSLTKYFLENYGINLFGLDSSDLYYIYTLDSSYPNLLVNSGFIAFAFMVISYIFMIRSAINDYNDNMSISNAARLAIIFSFCIAGISEPFFFNISYKNVTLLFAGMYLWERIDRIGKKKYKILDLNINLVHDINVSQLCSVVRNIARHVKEHLLVSIAVAISFAIIGWYIGGYVFDTPNEVYALRTSCDTDDDSVSLFLTSDEVKRFTNDDKVWILNYKDEKTPLLCFCGDITWIDKIRCRTSFAIVLVLIAEGTSGCLFSLNAKKIRKV